MSTDRQRGLAIALVIALAAGCLAYASGLGLRSLIFGACVLAIGVGIWGLRGMDG